MKILKQINIGKKVFLKILIFRNFLIYEIFSKIEILIKILFGNGNCVEKLKFWSKIEILFRNLDRNFNGS